MATPSARSSAACPIFDAGKDLNLRYLSTYEDVMQSGAYLGGHRAMPPPLGHQNSIISID